MIFQNIPEKTRKPEIPENFDFSSDFHIESYFLLSYHANIFHHNSNSQTVFGMDTRVYHISNFFENFVGFFYFMYKYHEKLRKKIWAWLKVIWPPHGRVIFYIGNSQKIQRKFQKKSKTYQCLSVFAKFSFSNRFLTWAWCHTKTSQSILPRFM